jgi:hypothetical protein
MKTMTMIGLLSMALYRFGLARDATENRNEGEEWSDLISPPSGVLVEEGVSHPTLVTFFGKAAEDSTEAYAKPLAWMNVIRHDKADSDRLFDPAKTTITTRFRSVVKQLPDGTWEITFGRAAVRR